MAKIQVFSCLAIKALDIDAIRIDKATQITVDGMAAWTSHTRQCAFDLGKKNFFITGEVTGGNNFGSLYMSVHILSRPRVVALLTRPPLFVSFHPAVEVESTRRRRRRTTML